MYTVAPLVLLVGHLLFLTSVALPNVKHRLPFSRQHPQIQTKQVLLSEAWQVTQQQQVSRAWVTWLDTRKPCRCAVRSTDGTARKWSRDVDILVNSTYSTIFSRWCLSCVPVHTSSFEAGQLHPNLIWRGHRSTRSTAAFFSCPLFHACLRTLVLSRTLCRLH